MAAVAMLVGIFGLVAQPAAAKPKLTGPVQLAGSGGKWKLLIPMNLPLELSGGKVNGQIKVSLPRQGWGRGWQALPHAGTLRRADLRSAFSYVHGVPVPKGVARGILKNGRKARVSLKLGYGLPTADRLEVRNESLSRKQKGLRRAGPGLCETLPRIGIKRSTQKSRTTQLPVCGRKLRWRVVEQPEKGNVVRYLTNFRFWPIDGKSGADELRLEGYFKGRLVASQRVQVRIGEVDSDDVSVIAFGDSVTAGFGYFGKTGKQMSIEQLIDCRPAATDFNDACSSNSFNRDSSVGTSPDYLPDFGLSRNISWAAQWANEYGITDFENYAVTGSAPSDWLPNGQFDATRQEIEGHNPDYILLTMGANPILSDVLFGIDNMGCALEADLFGDFRQCVLDYFAAVDLSQNLQQLYSSLVNSTSSEIIVMQYHLSIPATALAYSAVQLEMMGDLLNEVIASEAESVSTERITVVTPPRFDVGIDMTPLAPADFSCSFLGYKVDGPSVQSTPSQDELLIDHPLSFCSGPAIGPPWVISGDTGIHPSAAGYFQMASQIPAPGS